MAAVVLLTPPHSNPAPSFLQDHRDPHSVQHLALKLGVVFSLPKEFQRTLALGPIKEGLFSQHTKCWRSSSNFKHCTEISAWKEPPLFLSSARYVHEHHIKLRCAFFFLNTPTDSKKSVFAWMESCSAFSHVCIECTAICLYSPWSCRPHELTDPSHTTVWIKANSLGIL